MCMCVCECVYVCKCKCVQSERKGDNLDVVLHHDNEFHIESLLETDTYYKIALNVLFTKE